MAAHALRWTCAHCNVSVGRIDGEPAKLPASWSRFGGQVLCLTCSRTRAGEAAIDAAPAASTREDRTRLRRKALVEFEVARSPEASNRKIASTCRTSVAAVLAVRRELERDATSAPGTASSRAG